MQNVLHHHHVASEVETRPCARVIFIPPPQPTLSDEQQFSSSVIISQFSARIRRVRMRKRDLLEKLVFLLVPWLGPVKKGLEGARKAFRVYKWYDNFKKTKMKLAFKVGIGSAVTFFIIIIFGWVVFPKFLHSKIKQSIALKKGNDVREMYLKVPFPLVFKVYMFNVTNPDAVSTGEKPIVQEVGPLVFDEWKEKVDIEENEEEDSMSYTIKNTFVFNQKLSNPLTGNEVINFVHPLIAGMALLVEKDKPGALSLINKAINSIYGNPTGPFGQASMMDILFNGITIYCNVTDFAGKAVCGQLKTEAPDLVEVEPMIYKFSLFGPKNGTRAQRVKVARGIKNYRDVGHVLEFEGQEKLDMWSTDECNTFEGTDSTIFPPLLRPEEGLVSFAPDLCRSLVAYYVEEAKYAGLPVRYYTADLGDQTNNPEDKCYCESEDSCLKKGVFDLSKCVGAPLWASLPHFYLSDPSYINGVKGLHPNKEEHAIGIYFESITGSPVSAKKRLQFNMPLHPIAKVNAMKNMPEVVMPLFWVEEGVDLNSTWTNQLNNQLFRVLKITKIMKYLILVASIAGMAAAGYLHFTKKGEVQITPVRAGQDKKDISMVGQNMNKPYGGQVNRAMSGNEIDKY